MTPIRTARLKSRRRGPGGNWHSYVAFTDDYPHLHGYGSTKLEATNDLKSQMDPNYAKPSPTPEQ